jgi:RNA polymerase sigma factor (TIGR02999 family)
MTVAAFQSDSSPVAAPIDRVLLAECYEELRVVARRLLSRDWGRIPIQPTELAHEAMIRLLQMDRLAMNDRRHLIATAARLARQALIDEARRIASRKRVMPAATLTLIPDAPWPVRLEDVHQAVEALTAVSADHAAIVEMRFTLGMTIEEVAEATGLSMRTVKRRWASARAWLQDWLETHGERA